jgi:two-component system KDP operon response regulator KdpE
MYRVLVIGEKPDEAKALAFRLGLYGYEAAPSASDLTLALRSLFAFKPDAVVFEVAGNGCRESFRLLVKISDLPVLVIGSGERGDEPVWYLEEGAADYVRKPVGISVLSARINAVLKRTSQTAQRGVIRVGSLVIDLERREVRRNGSIISLTPTEFRLLKTLAENAGRACSQRMLLERVWGEDFVGCNNYLRLYIGYLRQKLEDDPRSPQLLVTEWGHGYRLKSDVQSMMPVSLGGVTVASA